MQFLFKINNLNIFMQQTTYFMHNGFHGNWYYQAACNLG